MADLPAPTEAWGLFDASGKLLGTAKTEGRARRLALELATITAGAIWPHIKVATGWSIRRVVVSVKEES